MKIKHFFVIAAFIALGTATTFGAQALFEQSKDLQLKNMQINTLIDEEPQLQIVGPACLQLVKTFPLLQMDPLDPRKIADGPDHWVIATAYFCMGQVPPSRDPVVPTTKRWMMPKQKPRQVVG